MEDRKYTPEQIGQWRLVKEALEHEGKTDCYFYRRAKAIVETGRDPFRW